MYLLLKVLFFSLGSMKPPPTRSSPPPKGSWQTWLAGAQQHCWAPLLPASWEELEPGEGIRPLAEAEPPLPSIRGALDPAWPLVRELPWLLNSWDPPWLLKPPCDPPWVAVGSSPSWVASSPSLVLTPALSDPELELELVSPKLIFCGCARAAATRRQSVRARMAAERQ